MKFIGYLSGPAAVLSMVWAGAFAAHTFDHNAWYFFPAIYTCVIMAGVTVGPLLFWLGDD